MIDKGDMIIKLDGYENARVVDDDDEMRRVSGTNIHTTANTNNIHPRIAIY